MEGVLGVRKGAWTEAEDVLLKGCIQTYGEGNWHKIPLRAGLNRCRKSCRLRWVNYLKPNIKRGEFEEDEVDLMTKLHKLLGNRWSIIAGRLPGRTANDVKNYWNTHLCKKDVISRERQTSKVYKSLSKIKVIKPQPRTLSKSFILKCIDSPARIHPEKRTTQQFISISKTPSPSPSPSHALASDPWLPEKEKEWWETMLEGVFEGGREGNSLNYIIPVGGSDLDQPLKAMGEVGDSFLGETERHCWSDMTFDNELGDLL